MRHNIMTRKGKGLDEGVVVEEGVGASLMRAYGVVFLPLSNDGAMRGGRWGRERKL